MAAKVIIYNKKPATAAASNTPTPIPTPSGTDPLIAAAVSSSIDLFNISDLFPHLEFKYTYTKDDASNEHYSSDIYEEKVGYTVTLAIILKKQDGKYPVIIANNTLLHGILGWPVTNDKLKELLVEYIKVAPDDLIVPSVKPEANQNFHKWLCMIPDVKIKPVAETGAAAAAAPGAAAGTGATPGAGSPPETGATGSRTYEIKNPNSNYAIGQYNTTYPGWHKAKETDWTNPAFQTELLNAHKNGNGWELLQIPLICSGGLHVEEGPVQINGEYVAEVGFKSNTNSHLNNVYSAAFSNSSGMVPWTTTPPTTGTNWTVQKVKVDNSPPCLYIRNVANVVIGGRRTHRKHSKNHLKKHKKTRIRRHL